MSGAVQRDDGLAGARRAGDARRAGVVALDPFPLLGMQEDRPLLPREIERTLQFLDVRHHAEAALRIGMLEGADATARQAADTRGLPPVASSSSASAASAGRWSASDQQRVLGRLLDIVQPLGRHAVAEQFVVGRVGEKGLHLGGGSARRQLPSARRPGRRSPSPSRGSRPAAPRPSSDASPACAAPPSRRPCRGGRRSRAAGSPRVWWTISRMSLLTRTDQKFLSFALSSLWKLMPGTGRD